MGSDRQSILLHENGKKHRENMEMSLQKRRDDKVQEEQASKEMEKTLKMMEAAAGKKIQEDMATGTFQQSSFGGAHSGGHSAAFSSILQGNGNGAQGKSQGEMKSWQDRKEKRKKVEGGSDAQDTNIQEDARNKRMKVAMELDSNEGHYQKGSQTFLEGRIYAPIFEEDMPVQIWIGSETMTHEYRSSDGAHDMWKTGIILRVHKEPVSPENTDQTLYTLANSFKCDVSYLRNLNDEDETIEKKVQGDRLRIQLGSDDLIPTTIEEARLSLMGGEEEIQVDHGANANIDENTGLSSWGTVSVKKIAISQEVKDERARARTKRREELDKEKMKEREAEARRMEETKHSNADDSALGAYDVWSTSGKGGYKGVQIHTESTVDVNDTAKSLSKGKVDVKFKTLGNSKMKFKSAKKKQNRRKTFADDDDE